MSEHHDERDAAAEASEPRDNNDAAEAAAPRPNAAAVVPVVESVLRPGAGVAYGAREFDYLCPHCRTVTRLDDRNYDLLTFYNRSSAHALDLSGVFAPFLGPALELVTLSLGDDFLAFRCTGCAAPVVAVFSWEALTHAKNLYRVERVFELRSWQRPAR